MTNKKKTILIVIDGLDYYFIKKNLADFHLFKELHNAGRLFSLESVVPADSIPSWTTIYTGMNPAEHGIIESIDYLDIKKSPSDCSVIKGKTFWDEFSRQGKKVFIFNPFMAYPAWDVNGLMVCGPVFEGGSISSNHLEIINLSDLPPLGGLVDHPTDKSMSSFLEDNLLLTQRQFESFHEYFRKDHYDFAFLGMLTSDRIQHFLWKYTDSEDKYHKEGNKLRHSILVMYHMMEDNIRKVLDDYGNEYNVIVISDHGHGRRCQKTFYINQWLISEGLIADVSNKKRMTELGKNLALITLDKLGCIQSGSSFFKKFKAFRTIKTSSYLFANNEKAYVPKFDGANPYGGINVNRGAFDSIEEYESFRQRIINGLMKVRDNGKLIMLWAKRREDIYAGVNISSYPDIIYLMDSNYGVDRGLFGGKLFGINAFHAIISGGHKSEGIIMGNTNTVESINSVLQVHDFIVSTVIGDNNESDAKSTTFCI